MSINLYEVAVVAPLKQSLTYGQPLDYIDEIPGGTRVLVPLGNRYVTGYILGPAKLDTSKKSFSIKQIREILDPSPIFPSSLIALYRWLSDYYHYSIGEVIKTALPAGISAGSEKIISLTEKGRNEIATFTESFKGSLPGWVEKLLKNSELPPGTSSLLWRKTKEQKLLKQWEKKGLVTILSEIVNKKIHSKKEFQIHLSKNFKQELSDIPLSQPDKQLTVLSNKFPQLKISEKKTLKLILEMFEQTGQTNLSRVEINRAYSSAGKALKVLEELGIIEVKQQKVYRDPFGAIPTFFPRPKHLTKEQEKVLASINPAVQSKSYKTFLLHGVTGCGKTEIYLQATEKALQDNLTVLVIVPEIALSSQLEAHFFSRFGDLLAVLHSGLSQAQRFDQWQRIREGHAKVVIGARSAIFAPLEKLGLIIVDEEHEPAYKQDDGLRYNGRDVAVLRGRFSNCPVILGSATPSVVSFHHAKTGKYTLLSMNKRVNDVAMPAVEIIDLSKEKKNRPGLCFSNNLVHAIRENLKKKHQTLLFVNRRGYAGFMLCADCGHIIQCRDCQVSLTLHKKLNKLVCHYCGYSLPGKTVCPECRSINVSGLGLGSEKIEEEVRLVFPHAKISRLDSDTATSKKKYLKILQAVRDREVDILIGTQMIAKGLHFPFMTLVGVVWADSSLAIPDYKSSERTYQLLSQVTGRAGRESLPGNVIVQTHQPLHYTINYAQQHDYVKLYDKEILLRQQLGYPPFSRIVNIRINGAEEAKVIKTADTVADFLRKISKSMNHLDILGPAPSPLVRIKNKTRWQILMKSSQPSHLHHICRQLSEKSSKLCDAKVQLIIDVDPENMM